MLKFITNMAMLIAYFVFLEMLDLSENSTRTLLVYGAVWVTFLIYINQFIDNNSNGNKG